MKEKSFEDMLDLICQQLDTSSKSDQAAYTMLLGAGFSYGVIPTAKEILIDAPVWLKRNNNDQKMNNSEIAKNFWSNVKNKLKGNGINLEFDKDTCIPKDNYISEAYKLLMSVNCPNGLTTPALRREYIRHLCQNVKRKNNPAHLYLACLLNHQRKQSWKYKTKFCRTILTTNFDPLLQDALQLVNVLYYMSDRPEVLDYLQEDIHDAIHLVYTHGSIHRYRLLNSEEEIKGGEKRNSSFLKSHFERHGVIVMGYGGWKDATMTALQEAIQFDGNLYWCVRSGDTLCEEVNELLKKRSACAFKVIIPDSDQAMNRIYERLTGLQLPEFFNDPIKMIIEQMNSLSFTEPKITETVCEPEQMISKSDFLDNFNSQIDNSTRRLKMARETYINPEKYRSKAVNAKRSGKRKVLAGKLLEDVETQAIVSKYLAEASRLVKAKDLNKAIELLGKALDIPRVSAEQQAEALIARAIAYGKFKPPKREKEIEEYTKIIEMPEASVEDKALALFNRAITYGQLKPPKIEKIIKEYTKIIEMPEASVEDKAKALCNRAITYGKMKPPKIDEAIADNTAVIELLDVPVECKAKALCNRATAYSGIFDPTILNKKIDYCTAVIEAPEAHVGCKITALLNRANTYSSLEPPKTEEAIADYTTVIEMQDVSLENMAKALCLRANIYSELKPPKTDEAIADYTAVIEMPDAPADPKSEALVSRANTYGELKPPKTDEAIADYTTVIEMPNVSAKDKAVALYCRANTYGELKPPKTDEAIADYTTVIEMPDAPADPKSRALVNRASAYRELEPPKTNEAIADYTAIIEMPDAPVDPKSRAIVNRAIEYCRLDRSKIEAAIADYTTVIEMPDVPSEPKSIALLNRANAYCKLEPPKIAEAIADYTAIIKMPDSPTDIKITAHASRGMLYFDEYGNSKKLLEDVSAVLKYEDTYVSRYNLGLAKLFLGEPKEALKYLISAIDDCCEITQIDGAISLLEKKRDILPEKSIAAYESIVEKLKERKRELQKTE